LYRFEVISDSCLNFGHGILQPLWGAYGQQIVFILGSLEGA